MHSKFETIEKRLQAINQKRRSARILRQTHARKKQKPLLSLDLPSVLESNLAKIAEEYELPLSEAIRRCLFLSVDVIRSKNPPQTLIKKAMKSSVQERLMAHLGS